jgi:hypothetical protein
LAVCLRDIYLATGQMALLNEARDCIDNVIGVGPWEQVVVARTRAGLSRLGGDSVDAARDLLAAAHAFDGEVERSRSDLIRRRDLARRVDGLLGDLCTTHVVIGDPTAAVAVLEGGRMCLPTPADMEVP